jgi:hypothetical protein
MRKGAWSMKSLSSLLLVSLSIGVAAPVAARPRVPVGAWPGVSDVLLNIAVAAPVAAWSPVATWPNNDSERPGSVLVFHKFIRGTFNDAVVTGQAVHARTEIEISVVCPEGTICGLNQVVRMRAHWVCPGCTETSFDLETTINGSLYFNTEGVTVVDVAGVPVITAAAFPSNATTTVNVPPCPRGYLIVWVTDGGGNAIKFDGLIGDVVLRDPTVGEEPFSAQGYNAIPIQAAEWMGTGDLTDQDGVGDLDFDGNEYQMVTGKIFGTVRYEDLLALRPVRTDLTLLTLDVASNRTNSETFVGLNFYTTDEGLLDTGTRFFCWREERLTVINAGLTVQRMGRKGLVESTFAEQVDFFGNVVPVTILGIVETREFFTVNQFRDYAYSLYHDGNPVPTTFKP